MRGFIFEIGLVVFNGIGGGDDNVGSRSGSCGSGGGGGLLFFGPSRFLKNEKHARGNYTTNTDTLKETVFRFGRRSRKTRDGGISYGAS